jgi:pseudaminic acid synthase
MTRLTISGTPIGGNAPPYVIAEMSANHNGRLETALELIAKAKECGASAVKMQTYRPDTITLDSDRPEFLVREGLWGGRSLYELYQWAHTPWEWHRPLFEHARKVGITLFSSPFDPTAIDLLEDLNAPAYKIASFEAIDLGLIRYAASTRKPLIISTGMATLDEIAEAVDAARGAGCSELALLHCVSGYPAPAAEYNLRTIPDLARRFDVVAGLSDHTLDNATAVTSVALGAAIIEKHFTLDRSGGGPDDSFSLQATELAALCRDARTAWEALGNVTYGPKPSEVLSVQHRRSLYFVAPLKAGDVVTAAHVRSVRPALGLKPKYLDSVLGRKVVRDVAVNTPVSFDDLE